MLTEPIITFKNPAIIDWLEDKGIKGKQLKYVTPSDIAHKRVYGHIPYWLAAFADSICEVSVPNLSPQDRDRFNRGEITIQELDAAGAHITSYQVRQLN